MSTPNFITQRDIPLMILDDSDYELPVCPECGGWMEEIGDGKWACYECDYTTDDPDKDCRIELDELTYEEDANFIEKDLDKFNAGLTFFKVVLRGGYYRGIQTLVECPNDPHNLYNDECRYYWDMCRSKAIRKHEAEERKVVKFLHGLKDEGLKELACVGIFSNGEAIYQYVN